MMAEFFAMGGYAAYVWPCYLLTALVFSAIAIGSLRSYRAALRDVARLEGRGQKGPRA